MNFKEKMHYFLNIDNIYKFSCSSKMIFPDGISFAFWLSKYVELFFDSLDEEDKNEFIFQKNKYLNEMQKIKKEVKEKKFTMRDAMLKLPYEFLESSDNKKFEKNSDLKFKCGISMSKWFFENLNFITYSSAEPYEKIRMQYNSFIKQRKILDFQRKKHMFYLEKNINKFNLYNEIRFSDDQTYGSWYKENEQKIINSNDKVSKEILLQKNNYLDLLKLKILFYNIDDINKFNENSNVRFPSGAIAYDFFLSILEDLEKSGDYLDRNILRQYYKYKDDYNELVKIKD